ncbi:hypothetical protein NRK67_13185 [Fusobacteria bacterium ZRK30]|nr:hypothetical protein NRK67_13185 [Fusobacteria bacterium ZRK30]
MDKYDEKTSLSYVVIAPNEYEVIDGKAYRSKHVEVLSDKIKVIYKDKEYYLPISKDNIVIKSHSGGVEYNWNIPLKSQVVRLDETVPNVTDDGMEIYFGKVKVDGTRIVDVPPVKFKKYIFITKVNLFLDGLNIDTEKTIYLGPLEEYKKDRRKALKEYKKLQKEKEKAEKKKEEKQNIFETLKEIWTS